MVGPKSASYFSAEERRSIRGTYFNTNILYKQFSVLFYFLDLLE